MQKCAGMSSFGLSIEFDTEVFEFDSVNVIDSMLKPWSYNYTTKKTQHGVEILLHTERNVFSTPCGKLFDLTLQTKSKAKAGTYVLKLLPIIDSDGNAELLDKQGHELSFALASQRGNYRLGSGWSGVYQSVDSAEWQQNGQHMDSYEKLADITLLSGCITVVD